jgi:short-subunit dehydrogenase
MALPLPTPGSTCLVTGASSGIGADLARSLAARGHGVTLVARRTERLHGLAAELRGRNDVRVEIEGCDLGDARARERLAGALGERGLAVEVLVKQRRLRQRRALPPPRPGT